MFTMSLADDIFVHSDSLADLRKKKEKEEKRMSNGNIHRREELANKWSDHSESATQRQENASEIKVLCQR